ncbi:MAG TPA: HEAT repeat domain-containing protein [Acidimicrobiia bacterium]|nr:HEAT repeat domain-containing protein [Acidimicrobiia bacterium]
MQRAVEIAARGASGRVRATDATELAAAVAADPDPTVRAVALGALARAAPKRVAATAWRVAAGDADAAVRRRAAQTAPAIGRLVPVAMLVALLRDDDAWVAEAAAFALGERDDATAVAPLEDAARGHADALVREAAVAALGARGVGRDAVLDACHDKPAIRRRAVLALAAFDGPEVEAALQAALEDRDWQVRQAAEDLLH